MSLQQFSFFINHAAIVFLLPDVLAAESLRPSTCQVYQGVKKHGFIQPRMLAEQDVVITTYDVLRSELNYVDIPHSNSKDGRRFRNQKRYMAVPSPLVAVEWWRICLDEAQMVECPTAKVNRESKSI